VLQRLAARALVERNQAVDADIEHLSPQ